MSHAGVDRIWSSTARERRVRFLQESKSQSLETPYIVTHEQQKLTMEIPGDHMSERSSSCTAISQCQLESEVGNGFMSRTNQRNNSPGRRDMLERQRNVCEDSSTTDTQPNASSRSKIKRDIVEFTSSSITTSSSGNTSMSSRSKSVYSDYDPDRHHIEHGRLRMSHSDSSGTTMLPVQHKRLMMLKHGRSYSTGDTPDEYSDTDNCTSTGQYPLNNNDRSDNDRNSSFCSHTGSEHSEDGAQAYQKDRPKSSSPHDRSIQTHEPRDLQKSSQNLDYSTSTNVSEILNFLPSTDKESPNSLRAKALATKCPCPSYPMKKVNLNDINTWTSMTDSKGNLTNKHCNDKVNKLNDLGGGRDNDKEKYNKRIQRSPECPSRLGERRDSAFKTTITTGDSDTDYYLKLLSNQSDNLQIDIRAMENESDEHYQERKSRGPSPRDLSSGDSSREISPRDGGTSHHGIKHRSQLKRRGPLPKSTASSASNSTTSLNERQQRHRLGDDSHSHDDDLRRARESPRDYTLAINNSREVSPRDLSSSSVSPRDMPGTNISPRDMSVSSISPREPTSTNISPREYNVRRVSPNERPFHNTRLLESYHSVPDQRMPSKHEPTDGRTRSYDHGKEVEKRVYRKDPEQRMRNYDQDTAAKPAWPSLGKEHESNRSQMYNHHGHQEREGRSSGKTDGRRDSNSKSTSRERHRPSAHRHSLPHEERTYTLSVNANGANKKNNECDKRIRKRSASDSDFYKSPGTGYRRRLPQQPNMPTKEASHHHEQIESQPKSCIARPQREDRLKAGKKETSPRISPSTQRKDHRLQTFEHNFTDWSPEAPSLDQPSPITYRDLPPTPLFRDFPLPQSSPQRTRRKLNMRMKSFSLDTPEPPKPAVNLDESTKKKSNSYTNTFARATSTAVYSAGLHNRRSKFWNRSSSLDIEDGYESAISSHSMSPRGGNSKNSSRSNSRSNSPKNARRSFPTNLYVVLFHFKAREKGDLELRAGYRLSVIDSSDQDWWKGKCNGKIGYFPARYVERIHPGERVLEVVQGLEISEGDAGVKLLKEQIVLQEGEEKEGMVVIRTPDSNSRLPCPVKYLREV